MMSAVRVARAFTRRVAGPQVCAATITAISISRCSDAGASAESAGAAGGIPDGVTSATSWSRATTISTSVDARSIGSESSWPPSSSSRLPATWASCRPAAGFLEGLRERARRCGALLDLRRSHHLASLRSRGRARPCRRSRRILTALGKIMGGGVPIAAFGGRAGRDGHAGAERAERLRAARTAETRSALRWRTASSICSKRIPSIMQRCVRWPSGSPAASERSSPGAVLPYAVVQQESIVDFKFRAGAASRNYDDARRGRPARVCRLLSRDAGTRHLAASLAERSDVRVDGPSPATSTRR